MILSLTSQPHFLEQEVCRIDCSLEVRCVNDIKVISETLELPSSFPSFFSPLLAEWAIDPALKDTIFIHE